MNGYEILYEDLVGTIERPDGVRLSLCGIEACVASALVNVYGADITLSPPQVEALDAGLLEVDGHFVISAPTNSGKTLIALLRIFHRIIRHGGRYVFVVPLKALAEEKTEELRAICRGLETACGRKVEVVVSTGDYKLTGDMPDTPPPEKGEILVCTPERLEVIMRNQANHAWAKSVDTYVLDEFHLLGDANRGARFDILVARILSVCKQSSILALSATIGGLKSIQDWLAAGGRTVIVVDNSYRYPQLNRRLIRTDEKDQFILNAASSLAPIESLLVFVYRKTDAETLVRQLESSDTNISGVGYFHAGMSLDERRDMSQRYRDRDVRILVATTSLKMGVNTPASKVIIRDSVFPGVGKLGMSDVLQMLGRAGRGDLPGEGIVLLSAKESFEHLLDGFKASTVEALQPRLIRQKTRSRPSTTVPDGMQPLRTALLSEIASRSDARSQELSEFLAATYAGHCLGIRHVELSQHIQVLIKDKLIYQVENSEDTYAATRLGRTVSHTGLSAETGGMLAGFIRALIHMGQKQQENGQEDSGYLRRLSEFDLLCLACASYEARDGLSRVRSGQDISSVIEFVEQLAPDEKPLFNLWRDTASSEYPTRRLLASLKFASASGSDQEQQIQYYRVLRTGMMLYEHAHGLPIVQLTIKYGIYPGAFENQQKGQITWVLNGLAQICSSNKCYKLDFLAMRIFELIEDLTLGAGLGKLMVLEGFGRRSAEKLLAAGIQNLSDQRLRSLETLQSIGLSNSLAKKVTQVTNRQMR
jgi:helicase